MGIGIGHPGEAAPDVASRQARACQLASLCLGGRPTNPEDATPPGM